METELQQLKEYIDRIALEIPYFIDTKKRNDKQCYELMSGIFYLVYECCNEIKLNHNLSNMIKTNINKLYDEIILIYSFNLDKAFMFSKWITRCLNLIYKYALSLELYISIVNIRQTTTDIGEN